MHWPTMWGIAEMNVFFRIFTDFPFGIMLSELLFARYSKRRSGFWLRVLTAVPFCVVYALIANHYGTDSTGFILLDKLLILLIMALTGAWVWFCFDCDITEYLFCILAAYAVQHFHHNLTVNLEILCETWMKTPFKPWESAALSIALMVLTYYAVNQFLVRRLKDADISRVDQPRMLVNGLFFLLMTVFFIPDLPEAFSMTRLLNFLYYLAADALVLFVLLGLLKESRQSRELDILEQLLRAEDHQRAITTETIELINMKCHDLKHQISLLRQGGNDAYVQELENAVQIYDSSVKTGCETLDIILMEKLLLCEKHGIQLTCMADGASLNFMSSSDIYSLFGNALDNAIESVLKEENDEKRVISFSVVGKGQFLVIRVENYVTDPSILEEEMPVTTKADKRYHGFGLMSIRHIVNKYGGELSIRAEEHLFVLNILIPLNESKIPC